jgi:hypothetical protein
MPQSVKQTIDRNGHLAPKQIDMRSLNLLQLDKLQIHRPVLTAVNAPSRSRGWPRRQPETIPERAQEVEFADCRHLRQIRKANLLKEV